jgi:hypothetical protein
MIRVIALSLLLAAVASAADLPSVSLDSGQWACTDGAVIENGVVTLTGDPKGYVRATFLMPAEAIAGKTLRFAAQVSTADLKQGREITYASPKLKVVDQKGKSVKAVYNFGTDDRPDWTPLDLYVTVPEDQGDPLVFEIGLQLCSGVFRAKEVTVEEARPWRWRVLDGGHKSYFEK